MNSAAHALEQRSSFLNKVFTFFGFAVLLSGCGVYFGFHQLGSVFADSPGAMLIFFVMELILIFTAGWWRKIEPINKLIFAAFAFISGLTIVPLLSSIAGQFGGFEIIYNALFASTALFIAMALVGTRVPAIYARKMQSFLWVGLLSLIVIGIAGIFLPWGNTGEILYAGAGVILFSMFTMFDISRIVNDHNDDEYILAAMALYLDIFNLFIDVLRLIAALSRD